VIVIITNIGLYRGQEGLGNDAMDFYNTQEYSLHDFDVYVTVRHDKFLITKPN
jgi:hypothetical protein